MRTSAVYICILRKRTLLGTSAGMHFPIQGNTVDVLQSLLIERSYWRIVDLEANEETFSIYERRKVTIRFTVNVEYCI